MTAHRLDLHDRGLKHRHRWWAHCACGWIGVYRRRKCDAEVLYRQHVDGAVEGRRARRRLMPCPVTPVHDLPAELR